MKNRLYVEPTNRNLVIRLYKNVPELNDTEKTLSFDMPSPFLQLLEIPVKLPEDTAGVSVEVEEDMDNIEKLKFQIVTQEVKSNELSGFYKADNLQST